jgi:hypothetical protein
MKVKILKLRPLLVRFPLLKNRFLRRDKPIQSCERHALRGRGTAKPINPYVDLFSF